MKEIQYPINGAKYKHYKGGIYQFLFMAKHTETCEDLCVYKSITFGTNYVRPLTEWNKRVGIVEHMDRFKLIE